jgi:glycosyltransferase involved in cell wall biosynthesis
MKIAIDISGQFAKMTGIQHYVDSLLYALLVSNAEHEVTALAAETWSVEDMKTNVKDGFFGWLSQNNARVDVAGNDFSLQTHPLLRGSKIGRKLGNIIDGRVINPYKKATPLRRIRQAYARYDMVHIPEPYSLEFLNYDIHKSVITIYDITTITQASNHLKDTIDGYDKYFRYAKNKAARVITISEFSKNDIVEHLGIPADRIDVTPLAPRVSAARIADPMERQVVLEALGLADTPFVMYAGTLEPRKNLKRLVEAFASVVRENRLPDLKLVLAGGNWNRHDLEIRLHGYEHEVGKQVITTGYLSNHEMNVLMSSCTAFAYVSEYEGFGLPPLEAMTCGAPVVTSNTTSLPEVVGDAGLMVDPTDVSAIAGALHCLLTDSTENARRRVMSLARAAEFSWERTARLTLQSYEAALS